MGSGAKPHGVPRGGSPLARGFRGAEPPGAATPGPGSVSVWTENAPSRYGGYFQAVENFLTIFEMTRNGRREFFSGADGASAHQPYGKRRRVSDETAPSVDPRTAVVTNLNEFYDKYASYGLSRTRAFRPVGDLSGEVSVPREEASLDLSSVDSASGIDRLVAHCAGLDPEVVLCMPGDGGDGAPTHPYSVRDCGNGVVSVRAEVGLPGSPPHDEEAQVSTPHQQCVGVPQEVSSSAVTERVLSCQGLVISPISPCGSLPSCSSGANGDYPEDSELLEDPTGGVSEEPTPVKPAPIESVLLANNTTRFIPHCVLVGPLGDRKDEMGYGLYEATLRCESFGGSQMVYARPVRWDCLRRYLPIIYGAAASNSFAGLGDGPVDSRNVYEFFEEGGNAANRNFELVHRCYASGRACRNLAGYQAEVPSALCGPASVYGCAPARVTPANCGSFIKPKKPNTIDLTTSD